MVNDKIKIGMSYSIQKKVEASYTAGALYQTGVLDILFSTPALVSMMLDASIALLGSVLPPEYISVATTCQVTHQNPTIFGEVVTVTVTVTNTEGNKVYFDMTASDKAGTIGYGKHERVIVHKEKLLENAYKRLDK